jgi:hypothetical protein
VDTRTANVSDTGLSTRAATLRCRFNTERVERAYRDHVNSVVLPRRRPLLVAVLLCSFVLYRVCCAHFFYASSRVVQRSVRLFTAHDVQLLDAALVQASAQHSTQKQHKMPGSRYAHRHAAEHAVPFSRYVRVHDGAELDVIRHARLGHDLLDTASCAVLLLCVAMLVWDFCYYAKRARIRVNGSSSSSGSSSTHDTDNYRLTSAPCLATRFRSPHLQRFNCTWPLPSGVMRRAAAVGVSATGATAALLGAIGLLIMYSFRVDLEVAHALQLLYWSVQALHKYAQPTGASGGRHDVSVPLPTRTMEHVRVWCDMMDEIFLVAALLYLCIVWQLSRLHARSAAASAAAPLLYCCQIWLCYATWWGSADQLKVLMFCTCYAVNAAVWWHRERSLRESWLLASSVSNWRAFSALSSSSATAAASVAADLV